MGEGEISGKTDFNPAASYPHERESYRAVREAMGFYKIDTSEILVIHDELDLAPGGVKQGGSAEA